MANANSVAVTAIKKAAQKYGIDPAAMIAVSRAESGLNPKAIGDGGHAFGLFQFNNAGGVITGQANPERYLDPGFNAMEAARHIATIKGIHGARGKDAVALIVNKFERPANPQGEIQRATGYLSGLQTGAPAPTINSNGSQSPSNALSPLSNSSGQDQGSNPLGALLQAAMIGSAPAHGSSDQSGALLPTLLAMGQEDQAPAPTVGQSNSNAPSVGSKPSNVTGVGTGAVTTIKNPKIIGTPYHGTHTLGNWESDDAVDIAMPVGTPLYATADGTIGSQIGSLGASSGSRFAGQRLHLKTSDNELYYAHLSKLAVKAGQKVKKGQLLGYSGEANGVAHLHLGSKDGNPQKYA